MALDFEIDADKFNALPDPIKAEYKETGGKYKLDVKGIDDPAPLKSALENERNAHKETKNTLLARVKELETTTDRASIDSSWQQKLDRTKSDYENQLQKLNGLIQRQTVTDVAKTIAQEVSTAPDLLIPHILPRLKADISGETPTTRILDANGKDSALTLDDLKKEIVSDKRFSAIIRAGGASGGGAGGASRGGAATQQNTTINSDVDVMKMKPAELAELVKARIEARKQSAA